MISLQMLGRSSRSVGDLTGRAKLRNGERLFHHTLIDHVILFSDQHIVGILSGFFLNLLGKTKKLIFLVMERSNPSSGSGPGCLLINSLSL